ncbi:unnamed protein product [Rotaria sp. Silwood2]|nr:unnamed protein product [Rotaria sp. Silwood2]CAF4050890.1 unnamed protein product [Rotaria sp. Silwood2]
MSSFDANLIIAFQNALLQINRYLAIFIFVFGFVGNIANILVLSQRCLRSNPCARFFLFSSAANIVAVCSGLISRFLSTWAMDLTNTNPFLCKLRGFLVFSSITCGFWLMVLATVDRWLSSSSDANRRQYSTLQNAHRGMIIVVILSVAIQAHHLYCFEANLTSGPLKCYTGTPMCRLLSDLTFVVGALIFPLVAMIIFSLMTIVNVRRAHIRVQMIATNQTSHIIPQIPIITTAQENQRKRTDRQLLIMLFVQVFLIVLFTLPLAIQKFYSTTTADILKSPLQNTIETFLFNLFLLLYYLACGLPFYVNTLSGGVIFRKAVISLINNVNRKIFCRRV